MTENNTTPSRRALWDEKMRAKYDSPQFRRAWLSNLTTRQIATAMGIAPQTVTNLARICGLPKRRRGRRYADNPHTLWDGITYDEDGNPIQPQTQDKQNENA